MMKLACDCMVNRLQRLKEAFQEKYGEPALFYACAPGRVNLIGNFVGHQQPHQLRQLISLVLFVKNAESALMVFQLFPAQENTLTTVAMLCCLWPLSKTSWPQSRLTTLKKFTWPTQMKNISTSKDYVHQSLNYTVTIKE